MIYNLKIGMNKSKYKVITAFFNSRFTIIQFMFGFFGTTGR